MSHRPAMLQTPRLLLRAAQSGDAVDLHEAFADPEVMRYWSSLPHEDLARTDAWISSMAELPSNGFTDFVVCLKPEGSGQAGPFPIGKIGIFGSWPANEIGFILSRAHWCKGLAREALTGILEYLFHLEREVPGVASVIDAEDTRHEGAGRDAMNELADQADQYTTLNSTEQLSSWRYSSITADVDPRNEASIGLLRKAGFVDTGYLERSMQVGEEWVDSLYLRLEREEWEKRRWARLE